MDQPLIEVAAAGQVWAVPDQVLVNLGLHHVAQVRHTASSPIRADLPVAAGEREVTVVVAATWQLAPGTE